MAIDAAYNDGKAQLKWDGVFFVVVAFVWPLSHHPGKQCGDAVSNHQLLCSYLNKTEP